MACHCRFSSQLPHAHSYRARDRGLSIYSLFDFNRIITLSGHCFCILIFSFFSDSHQDLLPDIDEDGETTLSILQQLSCNTNNSHLHARKKDRAELTCLYTTKRQVYQHTAEGHKHLFHQHCTVYSLRSTNTMTYHSFSTFLCARSLGFGTVLSSHNSNREGTHPTIVSSLRTYTPPSEKDTSTPLRDTHIYPPKNTKCVNCRTRRLLTRVPMLLDLIACTSSSPANTQTR